MKEAAIRVEGVTKTFGEVVANHKVTFSVEEGEIHALLGENGAGKSSLMNILSGIYVPDEGQIFVRGEEVRFNSPKDAIAKGIGMVHQHFKLVDVQTAAENIVGGQKEPFFIRKKERAKKILEISQKYGFELDPDKKIYNMSVSEKQTVEILKVLYRGANILILDEPTAVLTPQETERLFETLRVMRDRGCAVIIITHKLHEVMAISDRITVLRKGEAVATLSCKETTPKELTDLMVGHATNLSIERPEAQDTEPVFFVDHLSVQNEEKVQVLKNVTFDIRRGEVLGVAGVGGSGQKELCEAIAGLIPIQAGNIIYDNENISGLKPREIIDRGINMSFIPEDRLGMGLVASMSMVDNLILKTYADQKGIFIDRKPAREQAKALVEQLEISTPSIDTPVKRLSGGNIQKVLVGRELSADLQVLVTAYPVRGLDINSSYTIYDMINEQKRKGVAILYVGEDLDVILELCDRIMVLCGGKVVGIVNAKEVTKEQIGLMMTGSAEEVSA